MLEQILPASMLISLCISYVLGIKHLTLQRLASGVAIIVGFFSVLVIYTLNSNLPIDTNIRIISGIIIMILIIALAIVLLLIPFLRSSNGFQLFRRRVSSKSKIQSATSPSVFNAEIVNKKQAYVRGVDSVSFKLHNKGNLTDGYLMNKIYAQIPTGVHDTSGYLFPHQTPNVGSNRRYIELYHLETAEIWNESIGKKIIGKLNGEVDTGWLHLDWKIPEYIRLGIYVTEMSVVNNFNGHSRVDKPIKDIFNIIDPDDSHYPKFNRINV